MAKISKKIERLRKKLSVVEEASVSVDIIHDSPKYMYYEDANDIIVIEYQNDAEELRVFKTSYEVILEHDGEKTISQIVEKSRDYYSIYSEQPCESDKLN